MKDLVLKAFLTIAVVVAVAATASAQTANLKVNIPFNFMAGDHSLSTGTYTIRTLNPSLVQLLDQNGHAWNVTTIREDLPRPEKEGRLHFNKYGNQYFLARAVWAGQSDSRVMVKSSLETQASKTSQDSRRPATNNR